MDPTIQINFDEFIVAVEEVERWLDKEGKMNLKQILVMRYFELHHNKWTIRVPGKVFENFLLQDNGIVKRMRQLLGQPQLFWEIIIDESLVAENEKKIQTAEDRLLILRERFPQMEAFVRKFNLAIKPESAI